MANAPRNLTQANYNAIRDHLFDRIHKSGEQVKNDFPNLLRAAIEAEAWRHFTDGEGKPFKNLVEWLHYAYPHGASMGQGKHAIRYDEALKLTEAASDVHRVLAQNSPSRKVIEQGTKSQPPRRYRPSMSARLERDAPRLHQQYLFGQVKSIGSAAREAGLVKSRPQQNLARAKAAFKKMSAEERADFLKWMKSESR